jgi:hypothetical protein
MKRLRKRADRLGLFGKMEDEIRWTFCDTQERIIEALEFGCWIGSLDT